MFRFQHTGFFIGLAIIPALIALYWFILQWKKKTIKKIGDERLVKELIKNYSPQRFALKFILIVMAFTTGVLALANLRTAKGSEKVNRNGIDVMIALDVSKSMLAQDIKPSRLERAKQVINKLIDKLSNDRIGIVVFAGRAYLQMPLTGDHGAAKMYLASATPDVVPTQGTVIADALKMCAASFSTKEKKYKSVVLISDGEDHDEAAIKIAGQMADEGVMINTIGIGSPGGAPIIDAVTNEPKKDNDGNIVISKLNEGELKSIAEKGNGLYQLFTSTDEVVTKLDTQLASMDQRTVTEDSLVNYKSFFQWFLIAALLF
jgi:Ca-activated chloride channel homolog